MSLANTREDLKSFIPDKSMVMPVHQQEDMPQIDRNTSATRVTGKDADPTKATLLASVVNGERPSYDPASGTEAEVWEVRAREIIARQKEEKRTEQEEVEKKMKKATVGEEKAEVEEKSKRGEYDHLLFEYFACYPRI